jgi:hypothetical protein
MTKMPFTEDDNVIKIVSPDGSDEPFRESILPARNEPDGGRPASPVRFLLTASDGRWH